MQANAARVTLVDTAAGRLPTTVAAAPQTHDDRLGTLVAANLDTPQDSVPVGAEVGDATAEKTWGERIYAGIGDWLAVLIPPLVVFVILMLIWEIFEPRAEVRSAGPQQDLG